MNRIAKGLGVIAILLLAGASSVGAAPPSVRRRFTAHFDGTRRMIDQGSTGWIGSSSYDRTDGTLVVDFLAGRFSIPPDCTVTTTNPSTELYADAFPQVTSASTDEVVISDSLIPNELPRSPVAFQLACVGTP